MIREFAVKAEWHNGEIGVLRRGFPTREAAEDHPVTLRLWKRVWVEEVEPQPRPQDDPPPRPWNVQWEGGRAYLIDASGTRIASLLGSQKRREHIAAALLDAFGAPS